ncbi:MAG: helix-turn-helix domain-containing protein [Bacteroidales bacterium]|nr:MAG: helix-turn-helix domain-containing protein [Bacteroidales bacterium]
MEEQPSTDDQFLKIIDQIIENNFNKEDFSVEDLAQKLGLSRSMLHRKLIKLTGKSARDLITQKRLIKAKELLENDAATVSEVTYKVGFSDSSYFAKVFKKHFDIVPGDVKKNLLTSGIQESSDTDTEVPVPTKKKDRGLLVKVLIILLVICIIGGSLYFYSKINRPKEKSLAVLPLDNLTGLPENSYIIDGMQDALIGELGQIKSIRVISRTSTLRYRDTDMLLPDIAKELGVNTIVEGSVHCLGDSLCLIVQLIDVLPKERHLLANEYRDDMHNALKIQKTAVKDIARNINIKLTEDQEQLFTEARQVDPETYKDYLRGLYQLNLGTPESFYLGIDYMQKAIKRDPGEPLAHAGLALGYAQLGHGYLEAPDAFLTAEAAANKALKLDPTLDEAHIAIGMLNTYNFWDWPKAQKAYENALAQNPNNEIAHAHFAWYHVLFDNKEKSLYHAKMATVLDPLSPAYLSWLAWLYVYFEEFEQAEIAARNSLELMENLPYGNTVMGWVYLHKKEYQKAIETHKKLPLNYPFFKMVLAYTYVQAGDMDKAIALRNEVEEQAKQSWVNPFERGLLAGMAGDLDKAFKMLEEAVEHHYYPTNHINIMIPGMKFLDGDPRYDELFQKMNLPYKRELLVSKSSE